MCAKNYENWLEVDKVIATISIKQAYFFGLPCILVLYWGNRAAVFQTTKLDLRGHTSKGMKAKRVGGRTEKEAKVERGPGGGRRVYLG